MQYYPGGIPVVRWNALLKEEIVAAVLLSIVSATLPAGFNRWRVAS